MDSGVKFDAESDVAHQLLEKVLKGHILGRTNLNLSQKMQLSCIMKFCIVPFIRGKYKIIKYPIN